MNTHRRPYALLLILIIPVAIGAWYLLQAGETAGENRLQASGTVEAVVYSVSPELAGRVLEVFVLQGQTVQAGQPLFRLDGETLQAQLQRATAAREAARAGLRTAREASRSAETGLAIAQSQADAAQVGLEAARLQHQMALLTARLADQPRRTQAWSQDSPREFELPVWYFEDGEEMEALQYEVDAAQRALDVARADYQSVIQSASNADIARAEERLVRAQAAFQVAREVLDRSRRAMDRQDLEDQAQELSDAAEAELDAARTEYDRLLSSDAAAEVREARARLIVARERYETALDRWSSTLTGGEALQVRLAELGVRQAELGQAQAQAAVARAEIGLDQAQANLEQAEAMVAQAEAEIRVLEIQMHKLEVQAAVNGVVLTRHVDPGEVIQPGSVALTIGQLDDLTITVYLPEDRYGQVRLGERARVKVDSFPGETFSARVTHIADQAEYTPRNVQTEAGRRTTVFAIELSLDDPSSRLKPGMPADVTFES